MPLLPDVTKWRRYLRFWGTDVQADVDDELRFHFEARAEELRARGVAPADAERTIREEFGDVEATRRQLREIGARMERRRERRWWWAQLVADARHALRGLRRSPGFACAVVATLALGIGANAAIFSAVDLLLLRAAPLLEAPDRTHRVYLAFPMPDGEGEMFLDAPPHARYLDLARWTRSFARTAQYTDRRLAVGVGRDMREMQIGAVSARFFGFFDAPPALGRYFVAAEDAPPAGAAVVVLSHAMWQSRFGGRADALGATLRIGPTVYTVIGVAPRGFVGLWPERPPAAFIPLSSFIAAQGDPGGGRTWWTSYSEGWASMLVQRKPGVTLAAANADLTAALRRSFGSQERQGGRRAAIHPRATAESILTERGPNASGVARVAALVGGMALVVLLIAGANVANLLLARALRRRREIAVRRALGVSAWRLLSHLLTESLLLAALGGAAGLLVAQWGGAALRAAILPAGEQAPVLGDPRTLAFVGAAVLLVGLLAGLAPAWQAARVDPSRHLRAGAGDGTRHRAPARVTLLVLQGAMSALLLVGAGLFVRSLHNVRQLRLGYDVAPLLTVDLEMREVGLDSARAVALRETLLRAAQRLPVVEQAALSHGVPLRGRRVGDLDVPGIDPAAQRRLFEVYRNAVTPGYFATMGTRIVRGRAIDASDDAGAPGAVVVSVATARLLWPGRDAIGQCMKVDRDAACRYVVGVVEDVRSTRLSDDPGLDYYLAAAQQDPQETSLVVRTRGDASRHVETVRRALQREMPGASYVRVAPFADVVGEETRSWRLGATLFVVFGSLALALAAVGLYAVIAYDAAQRSREVGIRLALGARAADVVRLGLRQGVLLGGMGIAIGTAVALAGAGRIAPLLFGVSPRDPLVFALVAVAMFAVSIAASFVPARRASRADPTVALRSE